MLGAAVPGRHDMLVLDACKLLCRNVRYRLAVCVPSRHDSSKRPEAIKRKSKGEKREGMKHKRGQVQ
jgi:hypothetical protein